MPITAPAEARPLERAQREREAIVDEVVGHVLDLEAPALFALVRSAYEDESRRCAASTSDVRDRRISAQLDDVGRALEAGDPRALRARAEALVRTYADDVAFDYDPRSYVWIARRVAPILLAGLLAPLSDHVTLRALSPLRDRLICAGSFERLKRLAGATTLVYVPTHLSHFDSAALGVVIDRADLPHPAWCIARYMFDAPIVGPPLRGCGGYRFDKRIAADLYKRTLKAYAAALLERGCPMVFYPGGTRSRSGTIESRLKLGLLGAAVEAAGRVAARGEEPRITVVPVTVNHAIVMEAPDLVRSWLRDEGRPGADRGADRSRWARLFEYARDMARVDARMIVHFGEPFDVLGNAVDDRGGSLDDAGRPIRLRDELLRPREPGGEGSTSRLAEKIVEAYRRDTHVFATHLLAFVLVRALARRSGGDVFALIESPDAPRDVPLAEVHAAIDRVKRAARLAGVHLAPPHGVEGAPAIVEAALAAFARAHAPPVACLRGGAVHVVEPALAVFYYNRLVGYALDDP